MQSCWLPAPPAGCSRALPTPTHQMPGPIAALGLLLALHHHTKKARTLSLWPYGGAPLCRRWKAVKKRARIQAMGLRSLWKANSPADVHEPDELLLNLPQVGWVWGLGLVVGVGPRWSCVGAEAARRRCGERLV